ncbi:hypothetical protein BA190_16450 [Labrys sp. WJW]|nr:hypothetical protein BA190_16450 [Labrys sp. WJW]
MVGDDPDQALQIGVIKAATFFVRVVASGRWAAFQNGCVGFGRLKIVRDINETGGVGGMRYTHGV